MKIKEMQPGRYLLFLCAVFLLLTPIVFAVFNSFKTMQDAFNTVSQITSARPTVQNYIHVFSRLPFLRITTNTFLIATTVTILKTVTVIPNYLMISKVGLSDKTWGVALPQLVDVLGTFLLRQSMRGIPRALIEAARMENVKNLKTMRDIIIPLVRPSIISMGIILFINSWNEYVWPALMLESKENYTLPLALRMYISAEGGTGFTIAIAASAITMMIPLVLYILFQRYIINALVMLGIKDQSVSENSWSRESNKEK